MDNLLGSFCPCSTMRLTALMSMAARVVVPKDYRYSTNRPWTVAAKRQNPPGKRRRKVFVEPMTSEDWSVFKGDSVSKPEEVIPSIHNTCSQKISLSSTGFQFKFEIDTSTVRTESQFFKSLS